MAKDFSTYFSRIYPVASNDQEVKNNNDKCLDQIGVAYLNLTPGRPAVPGRLSLWGEVDPQREKPSYGLPQGKMAESYTKTKRFVKF